ncbi:hypothetical protein [Haloterrigena salinisoli]|uniref:hypothetical protein n=1 Tax=Haloterrigena salinisoli TaxID=3132747 RepID=UPI0030D36BD4
MTFEAGEQVKLDVSGSYARGGEIVRYEWDVGQTAKLDDTGETITVTAARMPTTQSCCA